MFAGGGACADILTANAYPMIQLKRLEITIVKVNHVAFGRGVEVISAHRE